MSKPKPIGYLETVFHLKLDNDELKKYWNFQYDLEIGETDDWTDNDILEFIGLEEKVKKLQKHIFPVETISWDIILIRDKMLQPFMKIDKPDTKQKQYQALIALNNIFDITLGDDD